MYRQKKAYEDRTVDEESKDIRTEKIRKKKGKKEERIPE
jgi:hypothetical protein